MSWIQVRLVYGPDAGRVERLMDPPINFGRQSNNALVIQDPIVSRHHGRLECADGGWRLVCLSHNPTFVNRRAVHQGKPTAIKSGDVVSVGEQPIFEVRDLGVTAAGPEAGVASNAGASGASHAAASDGAANDDEQDESRRKARFYKRIGIAYVLGMALLGVGYLFTGNSEPASAIAPLTREQIARDVRTMPQLRADDREAAAALQEATEIWNRRHASRDGLFRAHRAYQRALAASGRDTFASGVDQQRYLHLEEELISAIETQYDAAYKLLRAGRHRDAEEAFRQVGLLFRAPQSEIHRNVEAQRAAAINALRQRRTN